MDLSRPGPPLPSAVADGTASGVVHQNATALRALEVVCTPLWVFDVERLKIVWANPAALELWQAESLAELTQRNFADDMSPTVQRRLYQYLDGFAAGKSFSESWTLYPGGRPKTVNCRFSGISFADGTTHILIQAVAAELLDDASSLRSIQALLHTSVMISLYDWDGRLLYCNPAAGAVFGADRDRLDQHIIDVSAMKSLRRAVARDGECSEELPVRTVAGQRWHRLDLRRGLDPVTGAPTILVSETDVTERRLAEQLARRLAYNDTLTDLPNRKQLLERLDAELRRAERHQRGVAVLFLDLDGFKKINDSLGHTAGDELLTEVARRLSAGVRKSTTVARIGGDEFVIVVNDVDDGDDVRPLAKRLLQSISRPIVLHGQQLYVSASIGVSLFPGDGRNASELIKNADLAMYRAKTQGRNSYCFYAAEMASTASARLRLETDLRRALAGDEFRLYYQPKVCLRTGKPVGAEALIRWQHPQRGCVTPDEFIPTAEEIGLISAIGDWVIRTAVCQLASWCRRGWAVRTAVNLSAQQLVSDALPTSVAKALRQYGAPPALLELEITESMLMGNDSVVLRALDSLHRLGVRLAIDDFGTGYSNLGYLRKYPIDCLKIDRSFISGADHHAIAELIITLGKMMDLTLVAEGVERQDQLDWLQSMSCDEYQGYYYSGAVTADEFERLWQDRSGGLPEPPRRPAD